MPNDFTSAIEAAFAAYETARGGKVALPPPRFEFGPYFQPLVEIGDAVHCQRQGEVRVTRWSEGPLPWPQCRSRGMRSLIIFADLERALLLGFTLKYGKTPKTFTLNHQFHYTANIPFASSTKRNSRIATCFAHELLVGIIYHAVARTT